MKKRNILAVVAAGALALSACTRYDNSIPDWPWHDPDDPDDPWTEITADYQGLPSYVSVFRSPARLQGQNAKAYVAKIDMNKGGFGVWGLNDPELSGSSESLQTPSQVYDRQGKPAIVINGGFFYTDSGTSYAASLAISNGVLLSPNINYASEDWISMYYPTRGVFLEHADGKCEAAWSYFGDAHYLYQSPAQNSWAAKPLAVPSASFPCEATVLEAKNGIGGGPVLIKAGKLMNTYRQELFDGESGILCDTRHPRTAIGITADKVLVLFVCEGRNMTPGIPGFTTEEVARILLDLGCVEALNLDGGGSSCMLINGTETISPSDGEQRPVGSCVYVK